jgi:hypothetical protein
MGHENEYNMATLSLMRLSLSGKAVSLSATQDLKFSG